MPIRVATWNVQSGLDADRARRDLEQTAAVLAGLGADLVALQEVDVRVPRSGLVHQARRLARSGGFAWRYAPAMRVQLIGTEGNALLVRGSIRSTSRLALTSEGGAPARSALVAEVEIDGQTLVAVAAHLDVRRVNATAQLREIVGSLTSREVDGPVLILGDLNMSPADAAGVLSEHGFAVAQGGPTYPATSPSATIDLVSGRDVDLGPAETVATVASDHLPVVVEVSVASGG